MINNTEFIYDVTNDLRNDGDMKYAFFAYQLVKYLAQQASATVEDGLAQFDNDIYACAKYMDLEMTNNTTAEFSNDGGNTIYELTITYNDYNESGYEDLDNIQLYDSSNTFTISVSESGVGR